MSRLPFFCILLLMAVCAGHLVSSSTYAEDKPKPLPPERPEFVSGKVTKVSAKSITISEHKQFKDELTSLTMDDATQVLLPPAEGAADRKPRTGKVSDVKRGDFVSATYKKEGMLATKITVAEPFKAHPKK